MTKRENLLKALRRDNSDYVPHGFSLCESLEKTFKEKTGHSDYMKYFDMPYRYMDILPTKKQIDYTKYFKNIPEGTTIDEWGIGYQKGSFEHFWRFIHPMEHFTSVEEVKEFPLPDVLADYRWEGFASKVKNLKERGLAAVYFAIQVFEPAWYLRGMENLLADMIENEEMAAACLDRLTNIKADMCAKLAASGIDMIVYGDDVGTQREMMMSPDMWRQWLKPTMKKVIQAAKDVNPDILAFYHSDGVIYDIIEDLIEIGVDVLNPIQPECMDPVKVKQLYGDRLSFWGTIGTQTTMPFGSPADVEKEVKRMIDIVGKDGGLVVAPTHLLEPEVPWENIESFVKAVQKYGKY
jgi:uroporphyrinogen decarboxylase